MMKPQQKHFSPFTSTAIALRNNCHCMTSHLKQECKSRKLATDALLRVSHYYRPRFVRHFTATATTAIAFPPTTSREHIKMEETLMGYCNVLDPFLQKPIRSLGWLKKVSLDTNKEHPSIIAQVRIPSRLHPKLQELEENITEAIRMAIKQMNLAPKDKPMSIKVEFSLQPAKPLQVYQQTLQPLELQQLESLGPGLSSVTHSVAVYSCKGGVGKSTVAVNLAYELAHRGVRVGLLDVDVHGPSLPTLVTPSDVAVRRSPLGANMVYPIEHMGVKLLSLGFVSPKSGVPGASGDIHSGAAVMRGPMTSKVVTQLLKGTDWGDLDILLLDFPPGTGDVQLTVCQQLNLSGAVIVTTPSKLALVDAVKGVDMFQAMDVPTLALVENMAFFSCTDGTKHFPFGTGFHSGDIVDILGIDPSLVFSFGISPQISAANESGNPLCLSRPSLAQSELQTYSNLAYTTGKQLFSLQCGMPLQKSLNYDSAMAIFEENDSDEPADEFPLQSAMLLTDNSNQSFILRMFSNQRAVQKTIDGNVLRLTHPKTGDRLDQIGSSTSNDKIFQEMLTRSQTNREKGCSSPGDGITLSGASSRRLFPVKIEKKGNYGFSCEWADGSTIIYSMSSILKAFGGRLTEKNNR